MAVKKNISIYQCKPGDILTEDIYDDCGILIVPKSTVISERVIKRLKTFTIRQLPVYQDEERLSSLEKFKRDYQKNLNVMKEVLSDLAAGRELVYEKVESISDSIYSKINSISNIMEFMNEVKSTDEYTYTHCINVSVYALLIAKWLKLPEEEIKNVVTTGILHDIGKSKIPISLINKKGPLLPEEFEQMKNHTRIGYKLSEHIPQLTNEIRKGILMHHEREDGKGYPYGVKGDDINLYAKIISIADVYDALTSERVYKKRITPFDTFGELKRIGFGHFDTKVLMTFLHNISGYYIGSKVKMNTGDNGEIIFIPPQSITTPIVLVQGKYLDLSQDSKLKIVEML